MNSQRLVIVTVVKNSPDLLNETCRSFENQTQRARHLILDGGSADGTAERGAAWSERLGGHFESAPDDGPYSAMNHALTLLDPDDRVWFVNAGDLLTYPNAVHDIASWTCDAEFTWGYGPVDIIDDAGRKIRTLTASSYSNREFALARIAVCHQTVVARVGALREAGGFDEALSLAADHKLILELGRAAPPRIWPTVVAAYRSGGISDRNLRDTARQQFLVAGDFLDPGFRDRTLRVALHGARVCRIQAAKVLYGIAPNVNWRGVWHSISRRSRGS